MLAVTALGAAMLATIGVSGAAAADPSLTAPSNQLIIDLNGQVYQENCGSGQFCHATLTQTDNYASEIKFSHGYHLPYQCSSCHTQFPHVSDADKGGITNRPTMKGCWSCHGVNHGGSGPLATGECSDCHNTPRNRLRPSFHTFDWEGKPHVAPGVKNLQTQCMMCHDKPWCVDCHEDEDIDWEPKVKYETKDPYRYDPVDGCLACHGTILTKEAKGQPKSFTVTGVQESAHADVSCQRCHIDFQYEKSAVPSKRWDVNAGSACGLCHDDNKNHREAKAEFEKSIHYELSVAGEDGFVPPQPGKPQRQAPTCASCHGGHYIQRLDTAAAKYSMQTSAFRTCAREGCHAQEWSTYDDYYHGKAYKRGAEDSPACWDCHGSHDIREAADAGSMVSSKNLAETCGQEGCHKDSGESFVQKAGQLIHQKSAAAESNPLRRVLRSAAEWLPGD